MACQSLTTLSKIFRLNQPYPFTTPNIELIQSYKERRVFSLLRTRSLPKKNNVLRLGITNNLCDKCSGTYVENELKILNRYSAYARLRNDCIPDFYTTHPSVDKLNHLYQTNVFLWQLSILF